MTGLQRWKYYASCLIVAILMSLADERYGSRGAIIIFIVAMLCLYLMVRRDRNER